MEQPAVPGEDDGSYVTAEAGGFAEQDAVQPGAAGLHPAQGKPKFSNVLPFHGNAATMNLNALILNNIQSSHYFKVDLYSKKTYHEVIDEMYYQVKHLEPWEKGSRKTAGQTGMCGGVRGVGAGGIVSTAFCILYKLYTLKLTRKQLNGLIHYDGAPQIRAIGFMYIRYTQPPADLWTWYEPFLEDEEEVDVRAGGGHPMTVGQMVRSFLTKLDWFSTLFPRIPVPITKDILAKLKEHDDKMRAERGEEAAAAEEELDKERKRSAPRDVIEKTDARDRGVESRAEREVDRRAKDRDRRSGDRDRDRNHERSRRSRSRERDLSRKDREREPRVKGALKRSRSRDLEWKGRDERDGKRSRSGDTERNKRSRDEESERRSRDRNDVRSRDGDYRRPKYKARSRSRSRDRDRRR